MSSLAKALTTIVLPDGVTVNEGEEFLYNGDFENTGLFEFVEVQNDGGDPDGAMNEEYVRQKAKDLKISNWHTKGVEKLLAEIAEKEKELADKDPEGDQIPENQTDNNAPQA